MATLGQLPAASKADAFDGGYGRAPREVSIPWSRTRYDGVLMPGQGRAGGSGISELFPTTGARAWTWSWPWLCHS